MTKVNRSIRGIYEFLSAGIVAFMIANPFGLRIDNKQAKPARSYIESKYEQITNSYMGPDISNADPFYAGLNFLDYDTNQISFEPSSELESIVSNRISQILKKDKFGNPTLDKVGFSRRMTNFSKYRDYIQTSGVDTALAYALGIYESGGNPRAKSPTGPRGLYQFNRETALRNGAKINKYVDERLSPEAATTKLLIRHLKEIKETYASHGMLNPALEQVLVTYHDGKITRKKGKALYESFPHLKSYIRDIIALRKLTQQNLLDYEPLPLFSEMLEKTRPHKVRVGDTIHKVSKEYQISTDSIKEVNPEIVNYNRLPINHDIKIPQQVSVDSLRVDSLKSSNLYQN